MRIEVFYGPTKNFDDYLSKKCILANDYYTLLSLALDVEKNRYPANIQYESSVLIVHSSDYSSVTDNTLQDFVSFIKYADIEEIYLQNPPDIIVKNLQNRYSQEIIHFKYFEYKSMDLEVINKFKTEASEKIWGQAEALQLFSNFLYINNKLNLEQKPIVIMLYGPSGVGKTETCKFLASLLEEEIYYHQFSMFQSGHYADFLYGGKIQENSLAKELLERKSNIILFDEFDKCAPIMYSALYELFDTGVFKDKNYTVNLKNTMIVCTSNYKNQDEIFKALGAPIFFRINGFIEYKKLSVETEEKLIDKYFSKYLDTLDKYEKKLIRDSNIKEYFIANANRLSNVRQTENFIRNRIASIINEKK